MKDLYSIYNIKNKIYLIPIILFGGAFPLLVYINVNDYIQNGFSSTLIIGPIVTLGVGAACVFFIKLYRINPFAQLEKVKRANPSLFDAIVADFESAEDLCLNVKRGKSYYFFQGQTNFLFVPIGQIKRLRISLEYSRELLLYRAFYVEAAEGKAKVYVSMVLPEHEVVVAVGKRLAAECGIVPEIQTDPEK